MESGIDASELNAFLKDLENTVAGFDRFLRDFVFEMGSRVIAKTKKRQKQWHVIDTGNMLSSWAVGNVVKVGDRIGIEILNGMEYASFIEYGHRIVIGGTEVGWYDGWFMMTLSIEDVERELPNRFTKQFDAWIKQKGLGND